MSDLTREIQDLEDALSEADARIEELEDIVKGLKGEDCIGSMASFLAASDRGDKIMAAWHETNLRRMLRGMGYYDVDFAPPWHPKASQ